MNANIEMPALSTSATSPEWVFTLPEMREETHFDDRHLRCFTDRPHSIYALLEDAVKLKPKGDALIDGPLRLSWQEVKIRTDALAYGLALQGIRPGERVALLLGNRLEFVLLLFALARLGAVCVPIGTRSQAPEIAYMLQDAGACAVFADDDLLTRLPVDSQTLRLRVSMGIKQPGFVSYADIGKADAKRDAQSSAQSEDAAPHASHEEDTVVILYTSGTTGRPKGAMLTHLNLVHSVMHFEFCLGLGPTDISIIAVPMSHVTGLVAQLLSMVRCAGILVIMPAFKVDLFLQLAERERLTYTIMVPAMYQLCLLRADFSAWRLDSWRIGAYGGAPMPPASIAALAKQLPHLLLMNAYGATEVSSPATIMPPGDCIDNEKWGDSVGCSVPCADIIVVDLAGHEVPLGESGEIWIRGPMVVKGYWNNPSASAQEFTNGYWHSGDIGKLGEGGHLYVQDRIKDVINRGGYKVFSSEVEAVLAAHPQVVESAVVGLTCPVLGERVHAFVVLRGEVNNNADESGSDANAQVLKLFCGQHLSDYKVPESFTLSTQPLARNANGKLMKKQLRETANIPMRKN
jgi:acyl-CoA synthetase (AMP-forming)/AMP-acid ligase II